MATLNLTDDEVADLLYAIDATTDAADDCSCDDRVCPAQETAKRLERVGNKILRQTHA